MSKSIMQTEKECYICRKLGFDTTRNLEEHHVLHGTANRKIAESDGLKVFLCHYHHRQLHDMGAWDRELQEEAQFKYMEYYGKSIAEFRSRYGKSYL